MKKINLLTLLTALQSLIFISCNEEEIQINQKSRPTAIASVPAPTVSTNGLIAHYTFDGSANDISGNNLHGLVSGASLTSDRQGNSNAAYQFDGDDYIEVSHDNKLNIIGSDFTIAYWFRLDDYSNNYNSSLVSKRAPATNSEGFSSMIGGTPQGASGKGNPYFTASGGGNPFLKSDNKTTLGSWAHHIYLYDAASNVMKLYVNGVLDKEKMDLFSPNVINSSENLFFGYDKATNQYHLKGAMDDIRIYNRKVTNEEVAILSSSLDNGLIAHYPLDGNADDISGNSLNGTVMGGAQPTADRIGEPSAAFQFDGTNDFIEISHDDKLNLIGSDFSISYWFRMDEFSNTYNSCLISKRSAGTNLEGFSSVIGGSPQGAGGQGNPYFTASGGGSPFLKSDNKVTLGAWTHHVYVYDDASNTMQLYVNGVLDEEKTALFQNNVINSTENLFFGYDKATNSYHFKGAIDDIKIYGRKVTNEEIAILSEQSIDIGLIAYYSLNGQANDFSGNNLNGMVQGAQLTTDRNGNPNAAYEFDGVDDFIEVSHDDKLNLIGSDFSISYWFRIDEFSNTYNSCLISKRSAGTNLEGFSSVIGGSPQGADGQGNPYFTASGGGSPFLKSDNKVTLGAWTHHAYVYDDASNTMQLFVNGVLDEEKMALFQNNVINSTQNLFFGYDEATGSYYLKGAMDEIRVYDRKITSEEIAMFSSN